MIQDLEFRELELVNEQGSLLFTSIMLDEKSLLAGYEADGGKSAWERFLTWLGKVREYFKKNQVTTRALIEKLEFTIKNQQKQWDTIKSDTGGKPPYEIEVTKPNYLFNDQGLGWYTDQTKQMDTWAGAVYQASPTFQQALKAAIEAAKSASEPEAVKAAMETLDTAVKTFYTVVGTNIPEIAPITVNVEKLSITAKSQEQVNKDTGKFYFPDQQKANIGPTWVGSGVKAISSFPSSAKHILERVRTSTNNWDQNIGSAKDQIKSVIDKFSEAEKKSAVAKEMSKFMKAVKQGMKIDQQMSSLISKLLGSANVTSGVVGKALNHFASSTGENKENQKTSNQQQGKEMFSAANMYVDHADSVLLDILELSTQESAYEDLEVGTEGFWAWVKKQWDRFCAWVKSLFVKSEADLKKAVEESEQLSDKIAAMLKYEKTSKIINEANWTRAQDEALFKNCWEPGAAEKACNAFISSASNSEKILKKIEENADNLPATILGTDESSINAQVKEASNFVDNCDPKKPNSDAWKFICEVLKTKASNFGELKSELAAQNLLQAIGLKPLEKFDRGVLEAMQKDLEKVKSFESAMAEFDKLQKLSSDLANYRKEIKVNEKETDNIPEEAQRNVQKKANALDRRFNTVCMQLLAICMHPMRVYGNAMDRQIKATRRFVEKIEKLEKEEAGSKDNADKKDKSGKESFSSKLIGSELAVNLYSEEVLNETLDLLDEYRLYIDTKEYLSVGTEGVFSMLGELVMKIFSAIGDLLSSLFGGGSSGGGSSSTDAKKTAQTVQNQIAGANQSTQMVDATTTQVAQAIAEKGNDEQKAALDFLEKHVWPLLDTQQYTVNIDAVNFKKTQTEVLTESMAKKLAEVSKKAWDSPFIQNWVLHMKDIIAAVDSDTQKSTEYISKDSELKDQYNQVFDMFRDGLKDIPGFTVEATGKVVHKTRQIANPLKASGSFYEVSKGIGRIISDNYYQGEGKFEQVECDQRWAQYKQLAKPIASALDQFDKNHPQTSGMPKDVRKFLTMMKTCSRMASIMGKNIVTMQGVISDRANKVKEIKKAWNEAHRQLLTEIKDKLRDVVYGPMQQLKPEVLLQVLKLYRRTIRAKFPKDNITILGNAMHILQVFLTRKNIGEEAFGERDFFWFLDAPHISDEKAMEMFYELISDETEENIRKQVENLDENNGEGYDPNAGSDMSAEIIVLENQVKLFSYGDLKPGQEGFFDSALRLLTSLADMVGRLFSTFKLVYRSFQGLKRTEYQSYKEKYSVTLMRARRQAFSDVASLQVPHPKGLQVKYITALEKLIATLQACDMTARSKSFSITARNLRNQLEAGISTEGTVGALFAQTGEADRIRKMWEDSEKCFKGSGNTAEFKTLFSSMEEFNRVLDRVDDAAHFEYDVATVYSNLESCNDYLQEAVKNAKQRKAGDGLPISKSELVSLSEACIFMAKMFDVYGLTIQLENRVQHNVVEDVKVIVRTKKL